MSRLALGVASVMALLFVVGGASVSTASAAETFTLPACIDVLSDREARAVSTGSRLTATDHTDLPGFLTCNWILTSGKTSFLLDLGILWIDPKAPLGRKNLSVLGRSMCLKGPAAACDARDQLLDAGTATAAFRVLHQWWEDNDMASSPYRVGSDLAFWINAGSGKTDLYLLIAGGHAGVLLHTACARVAKGKANVPFPACTREAMRFARANFRDWWATR